MTSTQRWFWILAALAAALLFGPASVALAQGHDHEHGHGHGGGGWHGGYGHGGGWYGYGPYWGWGWPYYYGYGYGYDYPYDYGYPYDYSAYPPTYQSSPGPAAQQAPATWYYCTNPRGYYPYVQSCSGPWQPVPATPPGVQ